MCRSTLVFVGLLTVFYSVITADAAIAVEPAINKQGAHWTLELPEKIKKAILEFNPAFRPWELKDYSLRIRKEYKKADPRESPFALSLTQIMMEGQT